MTAEVFDDRRSILGEGALWHPRLERLFWFDIMGKRLFSRMGGERQEWTFDRHASAAGWVDDSTLLVATERDLIRFDILTGASDVVVPLEASNALTRSNDGRADPYGGFWIGTMGKMADAGAGKIYRYYQGEIRPLYDGITIPNAICFTPDGRQACFADTDKRLVWRVSLNEEGWPRGEPEIYLDHRAAGVNPDGAVIDAEGCFVCAEWGGWSVGRYDSGGTLIEEFSVPVEQPSCPALADGILYVTTARQGLPEVQADSQPLAGMTFRIETGMTGQQEHQVIL
ncbi:SMP-30/gluconolactonase/LRE family protein [Rhodophyticola porphyridii]|uniref:SMP-30/gluconolactonase/LRE family protein n=1 Tax=Rhodophyticola porphyridii TaxID=1852017 RepID=A0A3L9Y4G5_9RHOB|nr:SMP-30/gluconolactonase/LRE family protein [Rhodophyticola porphyridii]RMA43649.1 SMP-30/gluconolactonase/LRE family protein [Rhodophyticola porphyridii]